MKKSVNLEFCKDCPNLRVKTFSKGRLNTCPPECITPGKCDRMPIDINYKSQKGG